MAGASSSWWESLESDTLPWLLDTEHPSLLWRVLIELVGRPLDSPAVSRARGGADVAEPLATLLAPLRPDGSWDLESSPWTQWDGAVWRVIAAAQWGADPTDPRLCAAIDRLLEADELHLQASHPSAWARWLQAAAELGWGGDPRLEEGVARLESRLNWFDATCWVCEGAAGQGLCVVAAVAATGMLAAAPGLRRRPVGAWAIASVLEALRIGSKAACAGSRGAGHPNLLRTDPIEALWVLARAGAPFDPVMAPALAGLQALQDEDGRWSRQVPAPEPAGAGRVTGAPSRWITLRSLVALRHYAEAAGLSRLFPQRPRA